MIFVTVGTTHFDRLIAEVDRLAGSGAFDEPVVAQIGQGQVEPVHLEWVRYTEDIESYYRKSSLVICHGGVGTVFHLMLLKKDFIAVPNRDLAGDHQTELLKALHRNDWCGFCRDVTDLEAALRTRRQHRPYPADAALAKAIWSDLLAGGGVAKPPRKGRR